jgi:hypothetical protein
MNRAPINKTRAQQAHQPDAAGAAVIGGQTRFGARFLATVLVIHPQHGGLRPDR